MDSIKVPISICIVNSSKNEANARNKLACINTSEVKNYKQLKINTRITPKHYSSLIHSISTLNKHSPFHSFPKTRINQSFSNILKPNTNSYQLQPHIRANEGMFKINDTIVKGINNIPLFSSATNKYHSVNFAQELRNALKKVSSRLNISYETKQSAKKRYNDWLIKRRVVNVSPRSIIRTSLSKSKIPSKTRQHILLTDNAQPKEEVKSKPKIYVGKEYSHPEIASIAIFTPEQKKAIHNFIEEYSEDFRRGINLNAILKLTYNKNGYNAFFYGNVQREDR